MRRILTAAATLALTAGLAACTPASGAAPTVDVAHDTIVLDVRTPAEYAAGHLEGAVLLDFNGGAVAAALPELDPEAEYLVYCRSGNRSGQAIALLQNAGFTNVTNLGSLERAAATTGLPVIR